MESVYRNNLKNQDFGKYEITYFTSDEISCLLKSAAFAGKKEEVISKDNWEGVNDQRSIVLPALNKGLSEIISRYVRSDARPIVEIGSGIGYSLPSDLSHKTIRTQPDIVDCQSLRQSISEPIYQLDIEGLYNHLAESKKKIPLFFALNVFDTMSPARRKTSFAQLSQLQNSGDRMLIMLDTNPLFHVMVEQLESSYPEHVALPYFPLTDDPYKLSFIMVPLYFVSQKTPVNDLYDTMQKDASAITMEGQASRSQHILHQLQHRFHLKVISMEDFFVEQVKHELQQINYKTNMYYHAAFSTAESSISAEGIEYDLIYKSITDTATVRGWSLKTGNVHLANWLATKGMQLPHFDEAFLEELRAKKQTIFGSEMLVIEATKI